MQRQIDPYERQRLILEQRYTSLILRLTNHNLHSGEELSTTDISEEVAGELENVAAFVRTGDYVGCDGKDALEASRLRLIEILLWMEGR